MQTFWRNPSCVWIGGTKNHWQEFLHLQMATHSQSESRICRQFIVSQLASKYKVNHHNRRDNGTYQQLYFDYCQILKKKWLRQTQFLMKLKICRICVPRGMFCVHGKFDETTTDTTIKEFRVRVESVTN